MNASRRSARTSATTAVVLLACVAMVYLLLLLTTFKYGRDQGIYAVVADAMLRGGAPYLDAWDFKPPFIYFIYAASRALFGSGMHAIRIFEAAGLASLVAAYAILSRRLVGDWRAGVFAGVIAVLVHVQLEFWHTAQPESFGGIITAWALVCATFVPKSPGSSWKQPASWAASGALYAVAAMLKPPLGGGFAVSLGFVLYQSLPGSSGPAKRRLAAVICTAFAAGATVVLAAVLLFFWSRGALDALAETFLVFTPEYTALGLDPVWVPVLVWRALTDCLTGFSLLLPIGLVLFVLFGNRHPGEVRGALHILSVAFVQLVGVGLQAKFFDYHYGAALPLVALVAGWGFWKLWLRAWVEPRQGVAVFAGVALLLALSPPHVTEAGIAFGEILDVRTRILLGRAEPEEVDRLHSLGDVSFAANRAVAQWVAKHVPEDESLFIWGFEPMVYDMASRASASRFVYNVPQRLEWPGAEAARSVLVEELEQSRPAAILVLRNDALPKVMGDARDSVLSLRRFARLERLLDESYRRAGAIEDFLLYQRNDQKRTCDGCNVILISIDTLRADHLSCYGHERETSPAICEFFSGGTRFDRAYSQSSWTAPAHASMFTGLYPARHGVTYGPLIPRLEGHTTIFDYLGEEGYFTAALHGGGYINPVIPKEGVDFQRNIELREDLVSHFEDVVTRSGGRPLFLFLHGYDVHTPYAPERNHFAAAKPRIDAKARKNEYCRYEDAEDSSRYLVPSSIPSDRETQKYLETLYDSELLEVDRSLGRFFRYLGSRGLLDQTLIILTADHGEEFWDHGSCEHVKTVYDELIHVPLFLRGPGISVGVDSKPVAASIDIFPTTAWALGLTEPADLDGEVLFESVPRDVFSEAQFHYDSEHLRRYSVVREARKLIRDAQRRTQELYDLETDPRELDDLLDTGRLPAGLRKALTTYIERGAPAVQHEGALDDETIEQLRALGYID